MSWTRVRSEPLHQGRFLSLHRDEVVRPDSSTGTYEHVVVHDSARVVAVDRDQHVALVEDDFYLQQRRVLHLPGGGTDGQPPRAAALRELEEETGFIAGDLQELGVIDPLPSITAARVHLFLATELRRGAIHRDATEAGMTVRWETLYDALAAVRAGKITEAGSVTALLLADQVLREPASGA